MTPPDEFDAFLARVRLEASHPTGRPDFGSLEDADPAAATCWEPTWIVEDATGCVVGLVIDDSCYVVLYPHEGGWRPGTHIPMMAARKIAELEMQKAGTEHM